MLKFVAAIFSAAIIVSCDTSLCPPGKLLHENGKCYATGMESDTPCLNEFHIFTERKQHRGHGTCTCVNFIGDSSRPVVQWKKNNQCYWIFDQGPCKKGEWLTFNPDKNSEQQKFGICTKRTCPENQENVSENVWFEHNGKCLQVGVTNPEFCLNEHDKVYFALESPEPVCMQVRPTVITVTENRSQAKKRRFTRNTGGYWGRDLGLPPGVYLQCPRGYKRLPNGTCKKITHFEPFYSNSYGYFGRQNPWGLHRAFKAPQNIPFGF